MSDKLSINVDWFDAEYGPPEVRLTTAFLEICVGNKCATQVLDLRSRTVHQRVIVSLYPLALWMAGSWWRLRCEAAPSGAPELEWRLAHELPSAGYGYVWPNLTFVTDGIATEIHCRTTEECPWSPLVYLSRFTQRIRPEEFERATVELIELVLARLDASNLRSTELRAVWTEISGEISSRPASSWRSLEARLGLDPDEGSDAVLNTLAELSQSVGVDAVEEIAAACGGRMAAQNIAKVQSFASKGGLPGMIDLKDALKETFVKQGEGMKMPWDRGRQMAQSLRSAWQLGDRPITNSHLSSMLGISENTLFARGIEAGGGILGIAKRKTTSGEMRFLFRKARRESRRFEAARFVGDYLAAPATDRWLPLTGAKTGRQKLQRAFAAELLSPIDSLLSYLENDFSREKIEAAADVFKVSSMVVEAQLANNGAIPSF